VFELFSDTRLTPRVDFVHTLYTVPGAVLSASSGGQASLIATTRAKTADTYQITAGMTYKLGRARTTSALSEPSDRWTIGPEFAYSATATIGDLSTLHDPGIGAFVSYRLFEYLHADGGLSAFFQEPEVRTPWDGGRTVQALAGIKIGRTRDRVGIFGKIRGGVVSHAEAFQSRDSSTRARVFGRSNLAAMDLGGVVEVDAGRRLRLRFESRRRPHVCNRM
jgi:hypothetical protein